MTHTTVGINHHTDRPLSCHLPLLSLNILDLEGTKSWAVFKLVQGAGLADDGTPGYCGKFLEAMVGRSPATFQVSINAQTGLKKSW